MKVGILSLQGSFIDHAISVNKIGFDPIFIKKIDDLKKIDALILPGGESTAMIKIDSYSNIFSELLILINKGIPTLTTCAGSILLAKQVIGGVVTLPLVDIQISRNAYGRQVESFEGDVTFFDNNDIYCFIRAPKITKILHDSVQIIAKHNEEIVGVKQNNIISLTYHPELTNDSYYLTWLKNFIKEGQYVRSF